MKAVSESLVRADEKVEIARQDEQAEPEMVELGRVSDTQGAPVPGKPDIGNGLQVW